MVGDIVKTITSFKSISIASTIILASIHKIDIIKVKNIIFIILLTLDSIFKFDYDII
jgi:hypothetical protein